MYHSLAISIYRSLSCIRIWLGAQIQPEYAISQWFGIICEWYFHWHFLRISARHSLSRFYRFKPKLCRAPASATTIDGIEGQAKVRKQSKCVAEREQAPKINMLLNKWHNNRIINYVYATLCYIFSQNSMGKVERFQIRVSEKSMKRWRQKHNAW